MTVQTIEPHGQENIRVDVWVTTDYITDAKNPVSGAEMGHEVKMKVSHFRHGYGHSWNRA